MIDPKIRYVSFASDGRNGTRDMRDLQKKQVEKLKKFGFIRADQFYAYQSNVLGGTPFYQAYKSILDMPKGAGYWLWKPFFILQALNSLDTFDYVLYLDVDIDVTRTPRDFINNADKYAVAACEIQYPNYAYTKRDTLITLDVDREPFLSMTQVMGGALAIRNDSIGRMFVTDWLTCCLNPDLLLDTPSKLGPEHDGFKAHRCDQSILTILMRKYNFIPVRNEFAATFAHPTG